MASLKIASRSPVRFDPAGGGTDAPPYCHEHGGCVVNCAIARYAYAHLQWLPPGSGVHLHSLDFGERAWAPRPEALVADGRLALVKIHAAKLMQGRNDFLLVTHSDVPLHTGLGGSGAMSVAMTGVLLRATGRSMEPGEIAVLANGIERGDMGTAGGSQDHYGSAIGGAKEIVYHKGGGSAARVLRIPPAFLARLERDMLLVYTGGVHLSSSIHVDIKRSYAMENSPTVAAMHGLRAAARRMSAALEAGDIEGFIEALNASRNNHYALHESCDNDELRRYFRELAPHLLAGKTCGAGGGGFIVLLTKPGHKPACAAAAEKLGGLVWPWKMDTEGLAVWEEACWEGGELERLLVPPSERAG
jgi:D-glycero-alpha-D-manno-heptose-7-phosphate kinase